MTAARLVTTVAGAALVVAYAVLLGVDALVVQPRVAAPDLSPAELDAALAGSDWAVGRAQALVTVVAGVGLALAAAVAAVRRRWPVAAVAGTFLALLALGAPAWFVGTFSTGMTLADTFLTTGGLVTPVGAVLRAVSALAAPAAVVTAVVAARHHASTGPRATDALPGGGARSGAPGS